MNTTIPVVFSKVEAITAALALKASATEAYCDERLCVAASHYSLAAQLFFAAEYKAQGAVCRQLAQAIDAEAIAIAAGNDDDADYMAGKITSMQREG